MLVTDKLKELQMMNVAIDWVENIVGKGWNVDYLNCLIFPQFVLKFHIMWLRFKGETAYSCLFSMILGAFFVNII